MIKAQHTSVSYRYIASISIVRSNCSDYERANGQDCGNGVAGSERYHHVRQEEHGDRANLLTHA
jgi:hypothetical protein